VPPSREEERDRRSGATARPRVTGGWRRTLAEALCLLVVALIVLWQLRWRGFTGMADNGDWPRLMNQAGLSFAPRDQVTFGNRLVRLLPRAAEAGDWRQYPTSAAPFVRTGVKADSAAGGHGRFDLGVLGLGYLAVFLACVYGLLRTTRRLALVPRVLAVVVGGLLVTDYAFTAYFHSLYSEPVAILATLATIGAALGWASTPGSLRWVALTCLFLIIAVTAKAQYAPTGGVVALGIFGVGALALYRRQWRRGVAATLAAVLVLGAGAAELSLQPDRLTGYNTWDETYVELVPYARTPSAALKELGLDPRLAVFAGLNAYQPRTPLHDRALAKAYPHPLPTRGALLTYWVKHPDQTADLMWRGRPAFGEWRPQYIANITTQPHYPRPTLVSGAAAWSGTVRALGSGALPIVVLVLLAGLVAPTVALRRQRRALRVQHALVVIPALSVAASSQYVAVLLGDGRYELVKHLLLFDLLWASTAVGLVVWATASLVARLPRRRPKPARLRSTTASRPVA